MKLFVAAITAMSLLALGGEVTKPGGQANSYHVWFNLIVSGWGLWLLLA